MTTRAVIVSEMREEIRGMMPELVRGRKRLGMSQKRAADHLGIGQSFLSLIEGGHVDIPWERFRKYMEMVGMELGLKSVGPDESVVGPAAETHDRGV